MNRSDPAGKPDYTLVDLNLLERWAQHLTAHAAEKGRDNWRNASSHEDLDRFLASAWRHFVAWQRGDTDEDHAAALLFNVAGAELVRSRADTGGGDLDAGRPTGRLDRAAVPVNGNTQLAGTDGEHPD